MTNYLRVSDVLRMSAVEVGPDMLRDFGLLDSAVAQPQQTFDGIDLYPDLATKASALFFSLVRNHPFIDGNKRVAVMALEAFLLLNGYELVADDAALVGIALDVAEARASLEMVVGFVKSYMSAIPFPEGEAET